MDFLYFRVVWCEYIYIYLFCFFENRGIVFLKNCDVGSINLECLVDDWSKFILVILCLNYVSVILKL